MMEKFKKVSQVFIGFVFMFIALLLLSIGFVRIWAWFTANQSVRSFNYQSTRIDAGRGVVNNNILKPTQRPLELTKDWVFQGRIGVDLPPLPPGSILDDVEVDYEGCCKNCCTGNLHDVGCSCARININTGNFTDDSIIPTPGSPGPTNTTTGGLVKDPPVNDPDIYKDGKYNPDGTCHSRCMCRALIAPEIDSLRNIANQFRSVATQLESGASDLRDAAGECDDPWEICWWYGFGATADELNDAAGDLEREATKMRKEAQLYDGAYDSNTSVNNGGFILSLLKCCELDNVTEREDCLIDARNAMDQLCASSVTSLTEMWTKDREKYLKYIDDLKKQRDYATPVPQRCHSAVQKYCKLHCFIQEGYAQWAYDTYNITIGEMPVVLNYDSGDSGFGSPTNDVVSGGLDGGGSPTTITGLVNSVISDSDSCYTSCISSSLNDLCCSQYKNTPERDLYLNVTISTGMSLGDDWGRYCYNYRWHNGPTADENGWLGPIADLGSPPEYPDDQIGKQSFIDWANDTIDKLYDKVARIDKDLPLLPGCCDDANFPDKKTRLEKKMECIGNLIKDVNGRR